jgi:hypothetical protein
MPRAKQQGAVLIFFVFIVGLITTVYVLNVLNPASIPAAKNEQTVKTLMEAKSALIGWSVKNNNAPGRFPCPEDTSKIGTDREGEAASNCTLPAIGRLPFRTLGIGDLRDGNQNRLWYVISNGFRDTPINSETTAQLTIDGAGNSAVAIIFSPGTPLEGQQRSMPTAASPPHVSDYLDLTNNDGDNTFISSSTSENFNDRLLAISHQDLFIPVEKRVLRDAKNCLDAYAASSQQKYPWAAPVSDPTHTGALDTTFGRIPSAIVTSGFDILGVLTINDPDMESSWSTDCIFYDPPPSSTPSYWYNNNWPNLVFYQLASGYQPFSTASCGSSCLSVTGSGNPYSGSGSYRAVVIMGGMAIGTQIRNDATETSKYLEGINVHLEPSPSLAFETYRAIDSQRATVNDLVLCVDGNNNCH